MIIDTMDWDTDKLPWNDEIHKLERVDKIWFQEKINQNRLSIVIVWGREVCQHTANYIKKFWDRINFIAVDYHDIPNELKEDLSSSQLSFIQPPFLMAFYSGRAKNILDLSSKWSWAISWTISDHRKRLDMILPTNYTLSSKR